VHAGGIRNFGNKDRSWFHHATFALVTRWRFTSSWTWNSALGLITIDMPTG
jgi:hypothetical protein